MRTGETTENYPRGHPRDDTQRSGASQICLEEPREDIGTFKPIQVELLNMSIRRLLILIDLLRIIAKYARYERKARAHSAGKIQYRKKRIGRVCVTLPRVTCVSMFKCKCVCVCVLRFYTAITITSHIYTHLMFTRNAKTCLRYNRHGTPSSHINAQQLGNVSWKSVKKTAHLLRGISAI